MSNQITTAMVDTYRSGINMLAQQVKFRLQDAVMLENETGKRVSFDQVGVVGARKRTSRHADTPRIDVPHRRRWVSMGDFELSDLMDWSDLLKILNNPGGAYSRAFIAALNRAKDADIISAMLGTSFSGEDGTTPITLPSGQQIAAGGTGFTLGKVQQAADLLMGKAIFDDTDELHVAWTRKQEGEFMNNAEVKSVDYNTQRVLVKGTMSKEGGGEGFYGFQFHRLEDWTDELGATQRMLPKVSTTRTCVAWVKSGVVHNGPKEPTVRTDEIPGKSYSWQYYACGSFGSTRLQEEKVVQIDVVES
jgi:hypothetical protein